MCLVLRNSDYDIKDGLVLGLEVFAHVRKCVSVLSYGCIFPTVKQMHQHHVYAFTLHAAKDTKGITLIVLY